MAAIQPPGTPGGGLLTGRQPADGAALLTGSLLTGSLMLTGQPC